MKIGLLVLMALFIAVLVGLFVLSYKMLNKVRQQERLDAVGKTPERQLHPKLKAEMEQRKQAKK